MNDEARGREFTQNYIELHRISDHTDPRVQARRSVLNLKQKLTRASKYELKQPDQNVFRSNRSQTDSSVYSYRIFWMRKQWSSFFLNEFIVSHCTTEGKSLFYSLTQSFEKKNLVQFSWICLHLSLRLTCVHVRKSFEPFKHYFFTSTLSRCFSRENRFSCASLSSYDLLRKDVIIFVALRWTTCSFAISFAW